jgi:superfamily I DNA/RNA helicase
MSSRFSEAYHQAVLELKENAEQWKAFESNGNCVVLAGPGSGKTKVLTTKVARMLVEDIRPPRGLACLTYSNECVRELERRLRRLGVEDRSNLFVGTVHSFCLVNLLRPFGALAGLEIGPPYRVASADQQEAFLQKALNELVSTSEKASWFRTKLDKHRRTELDRTTPEWQERIGTVALRYEQLLKENGLVDFDGIVLLGLDLLTRDWVARCVQARFPVLVVDEYQDLGQPLHELVVRLLQFGVRIFVVGDPDQSIYGFTGARPELLNELAAREDVEDVTLRLNYRCGQRIVQAATLTLEEKRDYEAGGDHEGAVFFKKIEGATVGQAEGIFQELLPAVRKRHPETPLNEIAILYHTKFDGTLIASAADAAKVDYVRIDGEATYRKSPLTRSSSGRAMLNSWIAATSRATAASDARRPLTSTTR